MKTSLHLIAGLALSLITLGPPAAHESGGVSIAGLSPGRTIPSLFPGRIPSNQYATGCCRPGRHREGCGYTDHRIYGGGYPYGPVIPAGRVAVRVKPGNARVTVDGYGSERVSESLYEVGVLVGWHRVEVRAEGYTSYVKELKVLPGRRHELNIRLSRT